MKKTLLILFSSIAVSFAVVAQPTLTNAGVAPQIGDMFTVHGGPYQAPGNSGANQTWNFASFSGTSTSSLSMVSPVSTPFASSYPSANICGYVAAQSSYSYLQVTSGFLYQLGAEQPGASVDFTANSESVIKYPSTFNTTWTDTYSALGNFGSPFTRTGTITATADAYGTLITPAGTFINVLRIHFSDSFSDNFGVATYTGTQEIYQWYVQGVHYALFQTVQALYNGTPTSYANYINATVGIEEYDFSLLEIYPNPAVSELRISDAGGKVSRVEICNQLGETVVSLPASQLVNGSGKEEKAVDVSGLSNGIYFVRVIEGKTIRTAKFVKQ